MNGNGAKLIKRAPPQVRYQQQSLQLRSVMTSKHGFASGLERKLAAGIESGLLTGLHAVAVSRNGEPVLETYFEGDDQNWGKPLGQVDFGPDTLHDLRSVTKSIVGILYGVALDRGLVPAIGASLYDQFPEYAELAAGEERAAITVGHALSMTAGLHWDEFSRPYTDPLNSEIAMENAPDRFRFVLEQPVVTQPGEKWTYSGGCVALVGAIIERGTGKTLPEFAREALFTPLGIEAFEWNAGSDGIASAASGLRLSTRDLLKIGEMLLSGGKYRDAQIVSPAWLEESWKPRIPTGDGWHYGRLWFLDEAPVPALGGPKPWVGGLGNGGQRLWLMPEAGVACVIYSGNYNQWDSWMTPMRVWSEIILANLEKA